MLDPNETITLSDGDELIIPISSVENATDIMIVCALYENKINIWRGGGDEFTGILKGNAEEAKKALDEMRLRISEIKIDNRFNMTISAGIIDIRSAEGDPDIDGLVKLADKALYSSKESGRNRVCIA